MITDENRRVCGVSKISVVDGLGQGNLQIEGLYSIYSITMFYYLKCFKTHLPDAATWLQERSALYTLRMNPFLSHTSCDVSSLLSNARH